MKISLDWIRDYVEVDLPVRELVDRLTMIGLVPETVEERDGDVVLDLETYANRPDTLGHLGVAREIGTMLGLPLADRPWPLVELAEDASAAASVEIRDADLCPRYCGAVVRGLTVGPSPDWLRRRLEAMGLKSINNVVDVSNFVLFAAAQPIHAFDLAKLGGAAIVVRRAQRGERLTDFEGRDLELGPDMLVIADESKAVALAGIIGGRDSGVSGSTRDVLIESAHFDPVSTRLTAKKLGLSTDASCRFERGTDVSFPPHGALMAASLLCGMGGKAARGIIDVYPKPRKVKSVRLRHQRIGQLLGVDVPEDFVERTLARLGFRVQASSAGLWTVEVPTFRVDIDREADLIEEIGRFYGYDRIPSAFTPLKSFEPRESGPADRLERIRRTLLGQGFDEVINWSFADPEKDLAASGGRPPVAISNPISVKASILRTTLLPGLLENAARNLNRGLEGVHVFEIGDIYFWEGEEPREPLHLGLLTSGKLPGSGWQEPGRDTDFFRLKGAVEVLLAELRYEPVSFEPADHPAFEPGSALTVLYRGQAVACLGRLKEAVAAAASVVRPVFAAEVDLACLFEKTPKPFKYAPVPKFPGVHRDLSFLVARGVSYQDIRGSLGKLTLPLLEGIELIDRFSGPSLPPGKISLSFRFRYRHAQRTLTAEEVDRVEEEIIGHLRSAWDIQLREAKIDNRA
jgi:phenylalanyl-tRNA synthetase beta chain